MSQYFALVNSDPLQYSVPEIVDQILLAESLSVYRLELSKTYANQSCIWRVCTFTSKLHNTSTWLLARLVQAYVLV